MVYRQYELKQGQSRMTCWLQSAKKLAVGTKLTLHGDAPRGWWTVIANAKIELPTPPDRRWKVGGLV